MITPHDRITNTYSLLAGTSDGGWRQSSGDTPYHPPSTTPAQFNHYAKSTDGYLQDYRTGLRNQSLLMITTPYDTMPPVPNPVSDNSPDLPRVECSKGALFHHFQNLCVSGKATMVDVISRPREPSLASRLLSNPCRLQQKYSFSDEKVQQFQSKRITYTSSAIKRTRLQNAKLATNFQESEAPATVFGNKTSALDSVNIAQCIRTGYFLRSTNGIHPTRYMTMTNTNKMVPDPGRLIARLPFGPVTYRNAMFNDPKRNEVANVGVNETPGQAVDAFLKAFHDFGTPEDLAIQKDPYWENWDVVAQGHTWKCRQEACVIEFSIPRDTIARFMISYKAVDILDVFHSLQFVNGQPVGLRVRLCAPFFPSQDYTHLFLPRRPQFESLKLMATDQGDRSRKIAISASVIRTPHSNVTKTPVATAKLVKDTVASFNDLRVYQATLSKTSELDQMDAELEAMQDLFVQLLDFEEVAPAWTT